MPPLMSKEPVPVPDVPTVRSVAIVFVPLLCVYAPLPSTPKLMVRCGKAPVNIRWCGTVTTPLPFIFSWVTVSVPNDYTARAQRLLTGRRGQILGFAERAGWTGWDDVEALVPEAEMHDLIIELRSQTIGLGTFQKRFDHLAETRQAP